MKIGKSHDNQRIKLYWNPLLGLWDKFLFNIITVYYSRDAKNDHFNVLSDILSALEIPKGQKS